MLEIKTNVCNCHSDDQKLWISSEIHVFHTHCGVQNHVHEQGDNRISLLTYCHEAKTEGYFARPLRTQHVQLRMDTHTLRKSSFPQILK